MHLLNLDNLNRDFLEFGIEEFKKHLGENFDYNPSVEIDVLDEIESLPAVDSFWYGKSFVKDIPSFPAIYLVVVMKPIPTLVYVGSATKLSKRFFGSGKKIAKDKARHKNLEDKINGVDSIPFYSMQEQRQAKKNYKNIQVFYFYNAEKCMEQSANLSVVERSLIRRFCPVYNLDHNPIRWTRCLDYIQNTLSNYQKANPQLLPEIIRITRQELPKIHHSQLMQKSMPAFPFLYWKKCIDDWFGLC